MKFNTTTLDNEMCHFLPSNINVTNPMSGMYVTSLSNNASSILMAPANDFVPYSWSLIVNDKNWYITSIAYNASSKAYVIQGD